MKFLRKWLEIPTSNETELVEVVQLWEVRWWSRHGEYSHDMRPEMEAFPSEIEAKRFAHALRNAFALIRHTSGAAVKVQKAASNVRPSEALSVTERISHE